jgi:hypothetical protein
MLRSAGVFRVFVPRSHGELGVDLPTGLEVIAALSRLNGSVSRVAWVGSGLTLFDSSPLQRWLRDRHVVAQRRQAAAGHGRWKKTMNVSRDWP